MKKKIAIVRGAFLNAYEMQSFAPLASEYDMTAFGSLRPYHDDFAFPVKKLLSPMDVPDFPYKMSLLNRLFVDTHYLVGLERALRGYDLIHTAETYYHYTQQCLTAKRKGYVKKVIATVLENIPHNNEGIWGRKRFKERARKELDHMIALTYKTKEAMLAEGADEKKITVIPHCIDVAKFTPKSSDAQRRFMVHKRDFTILFTGRLETYKGVYDIIDALRLLDTDRALKGYTWWMIFAGDGTEKQTMMETEGLVGLRSRITHIQVPYDRIEEVYRQADIFVAPSSPTSTFEEQYCTAVMEAQAASLPIVTTRTGGIPENIGSAGILVNPSDPRALAYAIKHFMLHSSERRKYGELARRRAERVHDVKVGARKIRDVYDRILAV